MFQLPLEKTGGVIKAVSDAITHPIGQATLAAAPIAAATIPIVAAHHEDEKRKKQEALAKAAASVGLAPTSALSAKLPLPAYQQTQTAPRGLFNIFGKRGPTPQLTPASAMSTEVGKLDHPMFGQPMVDAVAATPPGLGGATNSKWMDEQVADQRKNPAVRWLFRDREDALRAAIAIRDNHDHFPKHAIAPLLAAGMKALNVVGTGATIASLFPGNGERQPSPAASTNRKKNLAEPSGAFASPVKDAAVATTPEGTIDNSQSVKQLKKHEGIATGASSERKGSTSKAPATTSAGATKAFKIAWYLPFQDTVKDFATGAYNAVDQEAGKLLTPTDTLDPVKTRTPQLGI